MNLETVSALTKVNLRLIVVEPDGTPVPKEFDIGIGLPGIGDPSMLDKAIWAIREFAKLPYVLRAYADVDVSPFKQNRQSVVNLVGSFRESLESDIKFAVWNMVTSHVANAEVELTCKTVELKDNWIRVAYDGAIFSLNPVFRPGPNHRQDCDTCKAGKAHLLHGLSEIRDGVFYRLDSLENEQYHYGENPIVSTRNMKSAETTQNANRPAEFIEWFIKINEGPLEMAAMEMMFETA